jgi:hypothetical protein
LGLPVRAKAAQVDIMHPVIGSMSGPAIETRNEG